MPRSLDIAAADGTIDAQLFTPAGGVGGIWPAVVLFTDIGGVRPSYDAKAQQVADAGYAVLMPNIYYRAGRAPLVPEGQTYRDAMPTLRQHAEALTPDAVARDFAALVGALDRAPECAPGPAGAVGYCLTGGFPLRMAAQHPERIAAAAGFHSANLAKPGGPGSILDAIPAVRARVYFGHADRDEFLPPDQIGAVDQALAEAGVHFTTELFGGARHGFTTADSLAFDPAAAALHLKRLRDLLAETVAPPAAGRA